MNTPGNINKFHTMDLHYYKTLLHSSLNKSNKTPKTTLDEYETKYQQLIAPYSIAYLEGSDWYIGPSFIDYVRTEPICKIFPLKLKVVCGILDST